MAIAASFFALTVNAQTISVEGKGSVEIEPEYATLSASVSHTAKTAGEAQAMVDRVMNRLLDGIDSLPINETTLDAGQLRIQPRYRWSPATETQEFQGYEATRELSFRLLELESLGDALQLLSQEGATNVSTPVYGSSETAEARARALAQAFASAKADANALAEAAGLTLGTPDSISTSGRNPPIFRPASRGAAAMSAEMAPRYEPGQLSVSASVSVVFSAKP
jgi:uncharacterized protein YggE